MKRFIYFLSLTFPAIALAGNVVFSCDMVNGKKLLVTDEGENYQYRFGTIKKTELVFMNSKNAIDIGISTNGETGEKIKAIDMSNGNYGYTISSGHSSSGVTVFNGKTYTTFLCKKNTVVNNIPNILM